MLLPGTGGGQASWSCLLHSEWPGPVPGPQWQQELGFWKQILGWHHPCSLSGKTQAEAFGTQDGNSDKESESWVPKFSL